MSTTAMKIVTKAETKKPKKGSIRTVNQGTRYDITGNLRRITRQIENGELNPTDVILISRHLDAPNGSRSIVVSHFGNGTIEEVHWALAVAKNRIEPA